jgi:hypothetical protein
MSLANRRENRTNERETMIDTAMLAASAASDGMEPRRRGRPMPYDDI